jgi:hypothetical protein
MTRPPRLFRRQGSRIASVAPHFDARALTEVAFRPDGGLTADADDFLEGRTRVEEHLLEAEADGPVQGEAEALLLDRLQTAMQAVLDGLADGEVAVIESAPGTDWPKTRERRRDVIVEGENRFHFHWRIEPPLRLGVWREQPR